MSGQGGHRDQADRERFRAELEPPGATAENAGGQIAAFAGRNGVGRAARLAWFGVGNVVVEQHHQGNPRRWRIGDGDRRDRRAVAVAGP